MSLLEFVFLTLVVLIVAANVALHLSGIALRRRQRWRWRHVDVDGRPARLDGEETRAPHPGATPRRALPLLLPGYPPRYERPSPSGQRGDL